MMTPFRLRSSLSALCVLSRARASVGEAGEASAYSCARIAQGCRRHVFRYRSVFAAGGESWEYERTCTCGGLSPPPAAYSQMKSHHVLLLENVSINYLFSQVGANALLSEALTILNGAHLSPSGRLGNMVRKCRRLTSAGQPASAEVEGKVRICCTHERKRN